MSKPEVMPLTPDECTKERQDENYKIEDEVYDSLLYCRTCASKDAFLIPIYKGEGLTHELNEKIEKYLPIHVTKDDDLPLQLCYNCASTIIAWHSLIIGCVEAERKLKLLQRSLVKDGSLISSKDGIDEKQSEGFPGVSHNLDSDDEPLIAKKTASVKTVKKRRSNKKDVAEVKSILENAVQETVAEDDNNRYNSEMQKDKSDEFPDSDSGNDDDFPDNNFSEWDAIPKSWLRIITCKYCGKISCASKHLKQHEKRRTCVKSFECTLCRQNFTKKTSLEKHVKRHERDGVGDADKRFTCGVCNKKFKFEDNGLSHEKLCGKTESTFKCSVCGKRFETKALADQHSTSHHKSCVCHLCGQSFNKPESLKQHIKTVHEEFKMVCHYCGREFTRKARLQEHLQHHTGQMEFTCHVCGKGSTNAYSFSVHLATHTQETPFSCSFCPRTFKHMKYVYLHERAVHLKLKSGKTYIKPKKPGKNMAQRTCPLCNKTFKRESAMLIHKRSVHEGKNGYICKLCGKDFKYTYLLYVHKKKHHFPELCKYVCQFCEKPFPVKTELEKHLRKHTGEKPYVCNLCGKTYSFHGSLNMHMKTQHENKKNFKCESCDASFNFRSHLARHMTAHADKFPVDFSCT